MIATMSLTQISAQFDTLLKSETLEETYAITTFFCSGDTSETSAYVLLLSIDPYCCLKRFCDDPFFYIFTNTHITGTYTFSPV